MAEIIITDGPSLEVNKNFAKNLMKQANDHNRIQTDIGKTRQRKFQNEVRKKLTTKCLKASPFKESLYSKTMYSDFVGGHSLSTTVKGQSSTRKIITPFAQVKKLVTEAAEFDGKNGDKPVTKPNTQDARSRLSRVSVHKRLLSNHLQHASVHNRLVEEKEMWKQHEQQKQRHIKAITTKKGPLGQGTMYSDREPNKVQPLRVNGVDRDEDKVYRKVGKRPVASPIIYETPKTYIGEWTQKLIEVEEQDPDRWGHSGFKMLYSDEVEASQQELEITEVRVRSPKKKKKKKQQRIVISETETETESDLSEEEAPPIRKRKQPIGKGVQKVNGNIGKTQPLSSSTKNKNGKVEIQSNSKERKPYKIVVTNPSAVRAKEVMRERNVVTHANHKQGKLSSLAIKTSQNRIAQVLSSTSSDEESNRVNGKNQGDVSRESLRHSIHGESSRRIAKRSIHADEKESRRKIQRDTEKHRDTIKHKDTDMQRDARDTYKHRDAEKSRRSVQMGPVRPTRDMTERRPPVRDMTDLRHKVMAKQRQQQRQRRASSTGSSSSLSPDSDDDSIIRRKLLKKMRRKR